MPAQNHFDPNRQSPREQAAHWFARLRSGECSAAERLDFAAWLEADAANRYEYEQLQTIWKELDGLAPQRATAKRRSRRSAVWPSLAAALLLLAIGGVAWHRLHDAVSETAYQTAKGVQRTVVLPDASTIRMNTDTALTVTISAAMRRVVLEKGEALFDVVHDEARPFEVVAGQGIIRDIGTRFNVYSEPGQVSVAVLEGVVEVRLAQQAGAVQGAEERTLSRGQLVTYGGGEGLSSVRNVDDKTIVAWRDDRLVFDNTPLAEVVRRISRYRAGKVVIRDPGLNNLKISGVFKIDNLDALFTTLEQVFPVAVERDLQGAIILSSRIRSDPPASPASL